MKNLVIVESPHKSSTIEKYLGRDYKVVASVGHIRDLATSGKFGLGVDVENDFKPNYIPIKGKKKLITALIKDVKNSDKIYLATDPDREGEAISWHLKEALDINDKDYERIVFNEITKNVVLDSFNNARKIDMDLVKSQETRRILDRIIGFRLSKLMQSKTGGKSAGRVQSAVLKLIVDREREIENFVEEEYYTIEADFNDFKAELDKYNGKKVEIKSLVEADNILNKLSKSFNIESCKTQEKTKASKPVFKTSTLQQAAVNKLGFPSSKTMSIAQKLYEGIIHHGLSLKNIIGKFEILDDFLEAVQGTGIVKCIIAGDPTLLPALEAEMQETLKGKAGAFRSEPFFLEIVPMGIDKAKGLSILLDKIGMKREELIAFGDGYNDTPMLQFAGMGVAMGNAAEEIKKAADMVTWSNNDDGVAIALENLIHRPLDKPY